MATEWMSLFNVNRNQLPAFCILIKGSDPAVISLHDEIDATILLKLFGCLADIANRNNIEVLKLKRYFNFSVERYHQLSGKIPALEADLIRQLDAMCNRYKANSRDKLIIAELFTAKRFSDEAIDALFAKLSFSSQDNFNANPVVKGVRNKARRLNQISEEIEDCRPPDLDFESVSDALRIIKSRKEETLRLINNLSVHGIIANSVSRQSLGKSYDIYTTRANQTVTILEKIGKYSSLASLIKLVIKALSSS